MSSIIRFIYPRAVTYNDRDVRIQAHQARAWVSRYVRSKHRKGARQSLEKELRGDSFRNNVYKYTLLSLFHPSSIINYIAGVKAQLEEIFEQAYPNCVEIRYVTNEYGITDNLYITIWHKELVIKDINDNQYISRDVFAIIKLDFSAQSKRIRIYSEVRKMSWTPLERKLGFISPHVHSTETNRSSDFCWGNEAPNVTIDLSVYSTPALISMKVLLFAKQFQALLQTEYTNSQTGHRPYRTLAQVTSTMAEVKPREVFENYLLPIYKENQQKLHEDFGIKLQDLGYPHIKCKLKPEILDRHTRRQDKYFSSNGKYYTATNMVDPKSVELYFDEHPFRFKGEIVEPQFIENQQVVQLETRALPPADVILLERFATTYLTRIFYEKYQSEEAREFYCNFSIAVTPQRNGDGDSGGSGDSSELTELQCSDLGVDHQPSPATEDLLCTPES